MIFRPVWVGRGPSGSNETENSSTGRGLCCRQRPIGFKTFLSPNRAHKTKLIDVGLHPTSFVRNHPAGQARCLRRAHTSPSAFSPAEATPSSIDPFLQKTALPFRSTSAPTTPPQIAGWRAFRWALFSAEGREGRKKSSDIQAALLMAFPRKR